MLHDEERARKDTADVRLKSAYVAVLRVGGSEVLRAGRVEDIVRRLDAGEERVVEEREEEEEALALGKDRLLALAAGTA